MEPDRAQLGGGGGGAPKFLKNRLETTSFAYDPEHEYLIPLRRLAHEDLKATPTWLYAQ